MKALHRWHVISLLAAFSVGLVPSAVQAANLLTNGGFESPPPFSGWVQGGNTAGTSIVGTFATIPPPEGAAQAALGNGFFPGSLSQAVATPTGSLYEVSFFLANVRPPEGNVNFFQAIWNGTTLLNLSQQGTLAYTQYTFSNLAPNASGTTTLLFQFQNDESFWLLDDVRVTTQGAGGGPVGAPEGGFAAALLLGGLCTLALMRRKLG
jgi:hypothetical protein